jgi:putative transposase
MVRNNGVHETDAQSILGGVQGEGRQAGQGRRQGCHPDRARARCLAADLAQLGSAIRSERWESVNRYFSRSRKTHRRANGIGSTSSRERTLANVGRDFKKSEGLLREAPPLRFAFVHAQSKRYPIVAICQDLNVSKAGYYAWRGRKPSKRQKSDNELLKLVKQIHAKSRSIYGRPRIYKELRELGVRACGARITRLMRLGGIKGKKRNRSRASSYAPGVLPAAPNILNRKFSVQRPNTVWVTDITYFPTKEGWLYLTVVIDCYSRRVVGWSMGKNIDAALALDALTMALRNRPFGRLLIHSDRGSQFASHDYSQVLEFCGVTASMSRKGNCWDNAVAESFFASIKVELKTDQAWSTRAEARTAILEYIQTWYNPIRRHSANGYLSPVAYENRRVF